MEQQKAEPPETGREKREGDREATEEGRRGVLSVCTYVVLLQHILIVPTCGPMLLSYCYCTTHDHTHTLFVLCSRRWRKEKEGRRIATSGRIIIHVDLDMYVI